MKNHGEDYENPARQDRGQDAAQKPADVITGHPPIIITDDDLDPEEFRDGEGQPENVTRGRDVIARFDAIDGHHYSPEDPPTFTAEGLREIDFISVGDGTPAPPHRCPDVPKNCRIVVSNHRRDTGNETTVEIDATSNVRTVIRFTPGEYAREHPSGRRRKLRGGLKKIRRLRVFNVAGELVHECPEVGHGRSVIIAICDDCRQQP